MFTGIPPQLSAIRKWVGLISRRTHNPSYDASLRRRRAPSTELSTKSMTARFKGMSLTSMWMKKSFVGEPLILFGSRDGSLADSEGGASFGILNGFRNRGFPQARKQKRIAVIGSSWAASRKTTRKKREDHHGDAF